MNIARDLAVLHEAGIDEDELIRDVAQFLRQRPPGRPAISPPLSDTEVQLLRETGAAGLDDGAASAPAREAIPIDLAVAHQRLVADAFSKEEVRARLGVVDSRVRQRVRERSLYAIERPGDGCSRDFSSTTRGRRHCRGCSGCSRRSNRRHIR